jgi:hypothetical protein
MKFNRYLFYMFCVLLFSVTVFSSGITDNLTSYYNLDLNANDSIGIYQGINYLAVPNITGKINNCYNFSNDHYIALGDMGDFNNFTIGFWFKKNVASGLESNGMFGSQNTNTRLFRLEWTTGDKISLFLGEDNSNYRTYTMSNAITDTNFHYIVVTRHDATVKFYIDNSNVSLTEGGGGSLVGKTINTGGNSYSIGFVTSAGGGYYGFNGLIDEVGVWKRELNRTEISYMYNSGNGINPLAEVLENPINISYVNITPYTAYDNASVYITVNATGGIYGNVNCSDDSGTIYDAGNMFNAYINNTLYETVALDVSSYTYKNITCFYFVYNNSFSMNKSSNILYINHFLPSIQFVSPTANNNVTVNRNYIEVNCTAKGINLGDINIYIYNSTSDTVANPTDSFYNLTNMYNDVYTYDCVVYDGLSVIAETEMRNITLNKLPDNSTPTVKFVYPTDSGTLTSRNNILINVSATANSFKNFTLLFYNNTDILFSYYNAVNSNHSFDMTGLQNGTYHFNATVYDNNGNYNNTGVRTVIIHSGYPVNPVNTGLNSFSTVSIAVFLILAILCVIFPDFIMLFGILLVIDVILILISFIL